MLRTNGIQNGPNILSSCHCSNSEVLILENPIAHGYDWIRSYGDTSRWDDMCPNPTSAKASFLDFSTTKPRRLILSTSTRSAGFAKYCKTDVLYISFTKLSQ
ncbi:hypothetical protein AA313_de0209438 [Arthrobotrys entomopaga]|nr:hypothetical protein AA313_de0209438 [Arthrobotrys entomopaga]